MPSAQQLGASIRSRGYLPHWERKGARYFVTFRLRDSLPRELVLRIRRQRQILEKARQAGATVKADLVALREMRSLIAKAERHLDQGQGACHMRDPRAADVVADALRNFDGSRYTLLAWCVMPNHAHLVFAPLGEHELEDILHSWKSYSAHEANRVLGRTGDFWQREYFDHLIRHEASFQRIVAYVENNPMKAGLANWRWVSNSSAVSSSAGVSPAGCPSTDIRSDKHQIHQLRRRDAGATK